MSARPRPNLTRITLANVHATVNSYQVLFELLKERTKEQSISHYHMPTMAEHVAFIRKAPYICWYLIQAEPPKKREWVGAIYLTRRREVGIFIFREHQGNGYATAAIQMLRAMHPGRILANINPANEPSLAFFKQLGVREIQRTFDLL